MTWATSISGVTLVVVVGEVGIPLASVAAEEAVETDELRFEFEPTGVPDMPQGKGAPGRLQSYIDGELVGSADGHITTPFMFNPSADLRSQPGITGHTRLRRPVHVHGHTAQCYPRRQRRPNPRPRVRTARTPGATINRRG